jgi:hypothetical protein
VAKIRFVGAEPHIVPWLGPGCVVQPDEVVEVPDEHYQAYVCQPGLWESVEEPAAKRAAGKAATSKKEG